MLRAVTVCVDYHDYLALTLPTNLHLFDEIVVVTSSQDKKTQALANYFHCSLLVTDLFYEPGAVFNKWKALEWALDEIGRQEWLCLLDADIVLPPAFAPFSRTVEEGRLYTPRRRMLDGQIALPLPTPDRWTQYRYHPNEREFAGYCQLFHAKDAALGQAPWHEIDWKHAGGADSFFQRKWAESNKVRPPFDCLHLGDAGRNWCGRATPYLDNTRDPQSRVRESTLRAMVNARTAGPNRFAAEKYKD